MNLSIKIPQINYIAFELVRVDVKKALSDSNYKAEQVTAINLATLPEQLTYRLQSRDAIIQTYGHTIVDKYPMQPERVTFQGTFGDKPRSAGGELLTGWERLKQFETEIVRRSKDISNPNFLYAINYYDFVFQRFASINIQDWTLNANARSNTNYISYTLNFTLTGKIVAVNLLDAFIKTLIGNAINTIQGTSSFSAEDLFLIGASMTGVLTDLISDIDSKFSDLINGYTQQASNFVKVRL